MVTSVLNNTGAQMALGELNKNVSKAGKLLGKISIGTRIASAEDDASGWSISEKMREQIRSLLQDNQNVQNGSALVKTAEGGIDNIIDELRNLKELAINAANDSNSDKDREIIQKEFNQKLDNINDIATETNYNGIPLLDGRWGQNIRGTSSSPGAGGVSPGTGDVSPGTSGAIAENNVTGLFSNSGLTVATADPENGKTTPASSWINGRQVYEGNDLTPYRLDFTSAMRDGVPLNASNMPDAMDGQGFYVVCAGNSDSGVTSFNRYDWCPHSHAFVFDADLPVGSGQSSYDQETDCRRITVGIAGVTDPADLARALFEGVRSAVGGNPTDEFAVNNGDVVTITNNGDGTYSLSRDYGMWITEAYPRREDEMEPEPAPTPTPTPTPTPEPSEADRGFKPLVIHHGTKANQAIHLFINDMHIESLKGEIPNASDLERLEKCLPSSMVADYREALHNSGVAGAEATFDFMNNFVNGIIQNDSAFQSTPYYRDYQAYKELVNDAKNTMTLDCASVRTQRDANVAIRVVEGALEYALNETTTMGAYVQRLNCLDSNITTTGENTQAAESVIRDADMAREMTEHAKANVLLQASQGMLAQANQNASKVLELLQ